MKHFVINNRNVFVQLLKNDSVIHITYDSGHITTQIEFSICLPQFLRLLATLDIVEIKNNTILWDEYIEDDGETTRHNQYQLSIQDYILFHMSTYDIKEIIDFLLYAEYELECNPDNHKQ